MAGGVVAGVHRADTSAPVIAWAAEQARLRALPLTLVHAWDAPLDLAVDVDSSPEYGVPTESRAEHGRAAAVLLAHDADLLVLGGHPAPHVKHATRLCLHRARCPVAVVPDTATAPTGRIVVGDDLNNPSLAALRWAADAAAQRHATLVVVHAWQVHLRGPRDVLHPTSAARRQQAVVRRKLEKWVGQAADDTSNLELRQSPGPPLDLLLHFAADADLLVLGRGTHHGLGRILHAAVSDDLSALVPCPVVVVPAPVDRPVRPA